MAGGRTSGAAAAGALTDRSQQRRHTTWSSGGQRSNVLAAATAEAQVDQCPVGPEECVGDARQGQNQPQEGQAACADIRNGRRRKARDAEDRPANASEEHERAGDPEDSRQGSRDRQADVNEPGEQALAEMRV